METIRGLKKHNMEIGIDSFAASPQTDGNKGEQNVKAIAELLERIELADQVGLDAFGIGEHYRKAFLDAAQSVILAAAAARTKNIRLTSAVTVLSTSDPVRVFQNFSTIDLISNGRAEIVAGRGSFIDAFPLFGYNLNDYDAIFEEKLKLLLKIRDHEVVDWSGVFRPTIGTAGTLLPITDTDDDGNPDFQDLDADNDGINDIVEAGIPDTDNDGIVDQVNPDGTLSSDADGDGFSDSLDPNDNLTPGTGDGSGTPVTPADTDSNGYPDYQDLDSDNDGINDIVESGNGAADTDNDGIADNPMTDTDNDGIPDSVDNDVNGYGDTGGTTPVDTDNDTIPDYQDLDSDDDGVLDITESGNSAADLNADGVADGADTDGDGIPDSIDDNVGTFGDAGDAGTGDDTSDPTDPNSGGTGVVGDSGTDADNDGIADSVDTDDSNFGMLSMNSTTSKNDFNNTPYGNPVSADVSINDSDEEGNNQTFSLAGSNGGMALADGTVVIDSDGGYTFTPANNFSGETEFSYSVCDDGIPSICDTAIVYMEVFAPISVTSTQVIANPDVNSVKQDSTGSGNVLSNDLDPDGFSPAVSTTFTNQVVAGVDKDGNPVANAGTLTLNTDGTYTFEPAPGFTGTVTQAYSICDGGSPAIACDDSELILEVLPSDGNSTFANDDATMTDTGIDATGDVSINDSDSELDNQSIEGFSIDSNGDGQTDLTITSLGLGFPTQIAGTDENGDPVLDAGDLTFNADGTYLFEPATDFSGNVVIEYEVCDDGSPKACENATLVLTVLDVKRDFGDGPSMYPAAWHRKMTDSDENNVLDGATDVWLGSNTDFETSQASSPDATGDTNDDAMTFGSGTGQFPLTVAPGQSFNVNITVNSTTSDIVHYGMWIDWDEDGVYDNFYSGSEATSSPATAMITVTAPSSIGSTTNVRLRADDEPLSSLDYQGGKSNGEVEDYQAAVVLPVKLTSFTGKTVNCDVQLNWTSATEENFSHYELERSTDGRDFSTIKQIKGSGNSTFDLHYQYLDKLASDLNYYRLKMVDVDGSFDYSKIINVETGCDPNELMIYPNPLLKEGGALSIDFYSLEKETQLTISDMLGRIVKRISLETTEKTTNSVFWDVSDLPSGSYLIQVVGSRNNKKFIIQE